MTIHVRVLLLSACCLAIDPAIGRAQTPDSPPQSAVPKDLSAQDVSSFEDLLAYVRGREARVESVEMELETTGQFPDGSTFSTVGRLRVLGKTHFQSRMEFRHSSDMESITETVRTPDGVWMHERDQVQGEVYLRMSADLMRRVDTASRVVGGEVHTPMPGTGDSESVLGSAMLADLGGQFDLSVKPPVTVDGQRCWVVEGPALGGPDADDLLGLGADQVDVLVRVADGAVVRMAQLKAGRPLMEVRITRLDLGKAWDSTSFVLEVPSGVDFVDIMDHPPHAAQIRRLFEEAESKGWDGTARAADATPVPVEVDERRDGDR